MPTNNEIATSLFTTLSNASLGYPISWPGVTGEDAAGNAVTSFQAPTGANAVWLEVMFMPNQGIDNGLSPNDGVVPQGIYQVSVMGRPEVGPFTLNDVADQVKALYPKNATISGLVRVQRHPYSIELQPSDDRMMVMVTIPYTG